MERIASRSNDTVKHYCLIRDNAGERRKQGLFAVETAKLALEAARFSRIDTLFYTPDAARDKDFAAVLSASDRAFEISDPVSDKLSAQRSKSGLYALVPFEEHPFLEEDVKENGHYLLLETIQDPGNLGTILRSASAFPPDGVLLSPDCCDRFSLKAVRASMGAVFKVPVFVCPLVEAAAALRKKGVTCFSAELCDTADTADVLRTLPGAAVAVGNEGNGISEELSAACGKKLYIPMDGQCESLNAGMAAGILLWEMWRHG